MGSYNHIDPCNYYPIYQRDSSHNHDDCNGHADVYVVSVHILCNLNELCIDNLRERNYYYDQYQLNQHNNNHHYDFGFRQLLNYIDNYDDDSNSDHDADDTDDVS